MEVGPVVVLPVQLLNWRWTGLPDLAPVVLSTVAVETVSAHAETCIHINQSMDPRGSSKDSIMRGTCSNCGQPITADYISNRWVHDHSNDETRACTNRPIPSHNPYLRVPITPADGSVTP